MDTNIHKSCMIVSTTYAHCTIYDPQRLGAVYKRERWLLQKSNKEIQVRVTILLTFRLNKGNRGILWDTCTCTCSERFPLYCIAKSVMEFQTIHCRFCDTNCDRFFHYCGLIINIFEIIFTNDSRNNVSMYISNKKISRVPSQPGLFPYFQTAPGICPS